MKRFGPFEYRVVANPTAWRTAQQVGKGPIVLYRVDHFSATEDVDTQKISELEDIAFREADATLYSSGALMRREPERHHGKGILFEHGVDLSLFDPDATPAEPKDLAPIGRPRIVMMGSLEKTDRIDQTLAIAALVPEAEFVIIGGGVKALPTSQLPNVHFLGQKLPAELPGYLSNVDIGLVVVARSEWGAAASPIKLKEYLAMGLPVVSTWFDDVELFDDHIRYGSSNEEVAAQLRLTIADQGPSTREERLKRVASEGWDAKAQAFMSILEELAEQKQHAGETDRR
jgi:glycosyltransferase involved in cell wall biosynthesis